MRVANLMTSNVSSISSDNSLSTAARLMWQSDCGAIPVRDPQDDRVIGIITDRDICMATWSKGQAPGSIAVANAMSTELVTCSPHDSISTAESLMQMHKVRRIPVVDPERRLLGIISLADIARSAGATGAAGRDPDLSLEKLAATVAAISQERSVSRAQSTAA
jgi:CBS domain-containing protein